MTKDLFALTFNEFSRWTYEEYYVNFVDKLPHRLLQAAAAANPGVQSCHGFAELQELFASVSGRRWKNPELYPHLNCLNIPDYPSLQSGVDALRIHVGLDRLTPSSGPARRFWRLRDPIDEVFEVIDGVRQLRGLSMHEIGDEPFPTVYRPHPHLFDDVQGTLYRGDRCHHETKVLWRLANDAVQAINRYSSDLAFGFCREIGTVAFMARQPGEAKSFSMRNFYIGGIFISMSDTIMVAEQFIHEYYHQCIWPWWMLEKPPDLPSDEQTMISPVSGQKRRMSVMIQALLIYRSLIDYYRFVLSRPESNAYDENQLRDAQTRLSKLERGVAALATGLTTALAECPSSRAMVEFITSTTAI
jgi:hypothetical protein